MRISIIATVSDNGVIGSDGKIPWNISADLQRFNDLTSGHHIIMGRRTYESKGFVFPDRTNIVLTRNSKLKTPDEILITHSLDEALNIAKSSGEQECFIIGGERLFTQALTLADRIYMTTVHDDFEGDAKFPVFNIHDWDIIQKTSPTSNENTEHNYSFLTLDRK